MHIDLYSLTLRLVLWCSVYGFPPCPALALRDLISKSFTGGFINQLRTTKNSTIDTVINRFVSIHIPFLPLFSCNQYTPYLLILILCMYVFVCILSGHGDYKTFSSSPSVYLRVKDMLLQISLQFIKKTIHFILIFVYW